jgi:lysophospholipase L1-like esterase
MIASVVRIRSFPRMLGHSTPALFRHSFQRIALLAVSLFGICAPVAAQTGWHFGCGLTKPNPKRIALSALSLYSAEGSGRATDPKYGFDLNTVPSNFASGSCSSTKPFFFSIAAGDGNYRVTLDLGGADSSVTTVRAESRRLLVDRLSIKAGGSHQVVFNVNVRSADILPSVDTLADNPIVRVQLKPREIGALDWDHKLTLEFNGDHPSVRSISIQPAEHVPTIYIAGDSTVVDQTMEPWAAWGQMLPAFFGPRISIANEAESGETIRSFVTEHRLAKIMSTIRAGDYLMIQFGHNDQKPGKGYVPAATDFTNYLLQYIADARSHGATPILVTPVNRRNFDADGKIVQTLGDYPEAMREVAEQQKVSLIDLNALSKTLFEAMGEEGTLHAFVHYKANTFPDQPTELADNTHFNSYGAYELARVIVQSIRDQKLLLARYLRLPIAPFDPAQPDPFSNWTLPPSPTYSMDTPYAR